MGPTHQRTEALEKKFRNFQKPKLEFATNQCYPESMRSCVQHHAGYCEWSRDSLKYTQSCAGSTLILCHLYWGLNFCLFKKVLGLGTNPLWILKDEYINFLTDAYFKNTLWRTSFIFFYHNLAAKELVRLIIRFCMFGRHCSFQNISTNTSKITDLTWLLQNPEEQAGAVYCCCGCVCCCYYRFHDAQGNLRPRTVLWLTVTTGICQTHQVKKKIAG